MSRSFGLCAAVVSMFIAASCGDDIVPTSSADLFVLAEDIDFDSDSYTVEAGEVDIELLQRGALVHSLLIEDASGVNLPFRLEVVVRGRSDRATVTLEPGTYVLYCDITGHRDAGMQALLTVTDPSG